MWLFRVSRSGCAERSIELIQYKTKHMMTLPAPIRSWISEARHFSQNAPGKLPHRFLFRRSLCCYALESLGTTSLHGVILKTVPQPTVGGLPYVQMGFPPSCVVP